ncbi:MAG: LysR family transcriptional regulator [Hyphomicrobiales bacterium]|nr:LysR family transcriptional regulator [Hyphomicrobiales bacterium]
MNLRSVDLNLLVALDALLAERHVTRAAEKIGVSQPAMSNALSRLRHHFKDDLLVRTAKGMEITTRGQALEAPLRNMLKQVERMFADGPGFDPARTKRRVTVRLSDLLSLLILPQLSAGLAAAGDGIDLDVVHLSPMATVDALEKDDIDVAVSMELQHSRSIQSETAFSDKMVCVMSNSHRLANRRLTLDAFLAERHVKVSMSPTDLRFVDNVLAEKRLKRRTALNVPHWLVVPHVLKKTDYLAVMPARLAGAVADKTLVSRDLPFASASFDWKIYWHRRHDDDLANCWLRDQVHAACKRLR